MKTIVQAIVVVLMLAGIIAAGFQPSHSSSVTPAVAGGSAPIPMCAPNDTKCDRGPFFPKASDPSVVAGGSAPIPMCAPEDTKCDRGPFFPKEKSNKPVLMAGGSAPIPMCAPEDTKCNRGPFFPKAQ